MVTIPCFEFTTIRFIDIDIVLQITFSFCLQSVLKPKICLARSDMRARNHQSRGINEHFKKKKKEE